MAVAVLATGWVFRSIRSGLLPGTTADARWTIALHEHWYRVWSGAESIRDLDYYFPLQKTLGTSDAFFVQGQFYSLGRLFGFDQITSWLIAGSAFFLIGALGIAVLSRQILASPWLQASFVLLVVASYPVLVGFVHVQLFGLLVVSWVFVGLNDLVSGRHLRRAFALLAVVPPMLALSSWYSMVLMAVVLFFLAVAVLMVSSAAGIARTVGRLAVDLWRTVRTVSGIASLIAMIGLWAAVLWIYLPSRGLLPPQVWSEVPYYSPQWSDVVNATGGGGGIWSRVYALMPNLAGPNIEVQRGFTPILLVAFLVATSALFRTVVLGRNRPRSVVAGVGRPGVLAAALSVAMVIGFLLVDDRGLSLFRLAWPNVPGLDSIRAPFRVMTIVYGIAIFVILRTLELALTESRWLRGRSWRPIAVTLCVGGLVLSIFVENQRTLVTNWVREDILSAALQNRIPTARAECDAVVVLDENPDDPVWVNQIDAVMFATLSGLTTPQGYSRADPVGYPGPVGTDPTSMAEWMRQQGFGGRICSVSTQEVRVLPD